MRNKNNQKALLSLIPFLTILVIYFLFPDWIIQSDLAVTKFVFNLRSTIGDAYFLAMTSFGNVEFVVVFVVATVLFIALALRKWKTALVYGVTVAIGNLGLNPAVKDLFQRARPDQAIWMVVESSYSFPSGHSFVAGMIYPLFVYLLLRHTKLSRYSTTVYVVLVLLVLSIAFSRIYLGVHYLTDVVAGLSLGYSFHYVSRFALNKIKE